MPEELEYRYWERGYLTEEEASTLTTPATGRIDISFQMTRKEPSLHAFWNTAPKVGMIVFALTFLTICLMVGVFKPRKQMPADQVQAMEFAQSKGRARKDGRTGVFFEDIAGLDSILDDLRQIVEVITITDSAILCLAACSFSKSLRSIEMLTQSHPKEFCSKVLQERERH